MIPLPWTDARVEQLKALWLDGLSATQVAAALGGVTRNAVIGKLHRLGVAGRTNASPPSERPRARAGGRSLPAPRQPRAAVRAARKTSSAPVRLPARVDGPELRPGLADLARLGRQACHWPIGDPAAADFGFCGRPVLGTGPYCADHHRRAYRGAGPQLESERVLRRLLGAVA